MTETGLSPTPADRVDTDTDEAVHRALSSPVRRQILRLLESRGGPRDTPRLADQLQLHVNTVRGHLGVLEEAGLVASEPEPRDRPGRPRLLFRATDDARNVDGDTGYRFLAEILARHLAATADDPAGEAERAGTAWGRLLVETPTHSSMVERQAALDRVVELLTEFGFAPELDRVDPEAPRLLLRRCPFLDVARDHADVVCSIHLGLLRGALDGLGADLEVRDLVPFAAPGLCVSHLQVSS